MTSIELYDQKITIETLQSWMDELNAIRTDDGLHKQYKVTIPVLLCWNMEEFIIENSYQRMVMDWVFDDNNYHKTLPFIVYHALQFDDRNRIREYYRNRMQEDGIDVEWDIIKSGDDLEQWIIDAPLELQELYNMNWRKDFLTLGITDTVGIELDTEYDPTIRQMLIQIDMV